jgi:hypothetical protein
MAAAIIPVAIQAFETLEPLAQEGIIAIFQKIHKKQATAADLIAEATAIVNGNPPAKGG